MKKLLLAAALLGSLMSDAQTSWAPAGERIKTRWAAEVDPAAPLPRSATSWCRPKVAQLP